MHLLKTIGLTIIVCTLSLCAAGQQAFPDFTPSQLRADLAILRNAFEHAHPGLYWYQTKAAMDSAFDATHAALNHDMNVVEFYRLMSPLVNMIGCLHTGIWPDARVREQVWDKGPLLPLRVHFTAQGRAYCLRNDTNGQSPIAPGDEITSINGHSIANLLARGLPISRLDGTNKGSLQRWNMRFNWFYPMFIEQARQYQVTYIDQQGQSQTTTIKAESFEVIKPRIKAAGAWHPNPPAHIVLDLNTHLGVAVLKVYSFDDWKVGKKKVRFVSALEAAFRQIEEAQVKNLVIDVRGNHGGVEKYGMYLLSYLVNEPFTAYKQIRFKTTKFPFRKHTTASWLEVPLYKAYLKHKKVNDTTYLLVNDRNLKPFNPAKRYNFTGSTYVLTDNMSMSTTADFASVAYASGVATFVGQETGGGALGNCSGYDFTLVLPNTNMHAELPLAKYVTNVPAQGKYGRGVVPHHVVEPTVQDLLTDHDAVMAYTLRLMGTAVKR